MVKKPAEIISTRLRMPTKLHRMLSAAAKRNNRSLNSEILWCIAKELGGDAAKAVEQMSVEQRRIMHDVLRQLITDPEQAAQAIASFDKKTEER
jgi:hypothetical protein